MAELNDLLDQLNNSMKDTNTMEETVQTTNESAYEVSPNAPAISTDILKVEAGKMVIYEKATPFYNSKILGVPLKYIAIGAIIFKFLKDN